MGVFRDCFACKSREQNDGAERRGDADAEDNEFAGTMAEVSGGESFKSSFTRAAKLAEEQKSGQTSDNACYEVGSKPNGRQAVQIVREPERDRAEAQQDHNFPAFLFDGGIDGAERHMLPQSARNLVAQEPT